MGRAVLTAAVCLAFAGGASAQHAHRHHWRETDTRAPASFYPWQGAPRIKLPASRQDFERYLKHIGAKWFVAGHEAGARLPDVPQTSGGPGDKFALALEFYFADEDKGEMEPGFIALLDASGRVVYVAADFARDAH